MKREITTRSRQPFLRAQLLSICVCIRRQTIWTSRTSMSFKVHQSTPILWKLWFRPETQLRGGHFIRIKSSLAKIGTQSTIFFTIFSLSLINWSGRVWRRKTTSTSLNSNKARPSNANPFTNKTISARAITKRPFLASLTQLEKIKKANRFFAYSSTGPPAKGLTG